MRRRIQTLLGGLLLAAIPVLAPAGIAVGISVNIAPPVLPVYVQPPIPAVGYIWAPGYWAWDGAGYYWVPGTWVMPPRVGLLWTPGYWGWDGGVYLWHAGYWGPHVGFYGGVNYGFGYSGVGFSGGYWRGGAFFYNRTVTNITNVHVTNVYERVVPQPYGASHVSFNGGNGGVRAIPTGAERVAMREHHVEPTGAQFHHEQLASHDRTLHASFNHGNPAVAATAHPGVFAGHGGGAGPGHPAGFAQTGHPGGFAPEGHAGGFAQPGHAEPARPGGVPQGGRPAPHPQAHEGPHEGQHGHPEGKRQER